MNRQEYEAEKSLNLNASPEGTEYATVLGNLLLAERYIASLEAEVESLKTENTALREDNASLIEQVNERQPINALAKQIESTYQQFYNKDMIPAQEEHLFSELSELHEALKENRNVKQKDMDKFVSGNFGYPITMKHTIQDELTDILILTLGLCSYFKMDIPFWIRAKMDYNAIRPDHAHLKHSKRPKGENDA